MQVHYKHPETLPAPAKLRFRDELSISAQRLKWRVGVHDPKSKFMAGLLRRKDEKAKK